MYGHGAKCFYKNSPTVQQLLYIVHYAVYHVHMGSTFYFIVTLNYPDCGLISLILGLVTNIQTCIWLCCIGYSKDYSSSRFGSSGSCSRISSNKNSKVMGNRYKASFTVNFNVIGSL